MKRFTQDRDHSTRPVRRIRSFRATPEVGFAPGWPLLETLHRRDSEEKETLFLAPGWPRVPTRARKTA
jgi:hypothetical protein